MKIAETKIYLKFLAWFLIVSLLPSFTLLFVIYTYYPDKSIWESSIVQRSTLLGVLISVAFVFLLSLVATRRLSKYITKPIQLSVAELSKVTESLLKSVSSLSNISEKNSEISKFLLDSSKEQKEGLDLGNSAVVGMVESLDKIVIKTKTSAADAKKIDSLAEDGKDKSELALESLSTIKHLVTENQKLSHALDIYTNRVQEVSKRMQVLAETAKFLSLNVSIEASKESFADEFSELVSQIRELNISTEQAAIGVNDLAIEMHDQIKQSRESSVYEAKEADKSIDIIGQTVKFLGSIANKVSNISGSVQVISKETKANYSEADNILNMIKDLNKKSKSLFDQTDEIAQIINQQSVVTKSLNSSSESLDKVTKNLNKLV